MVEDESKIIDIDKNRYKKGKYKELFSKLTEGVQLFFNVVDLGVDYGLGVKDVWQLDRPEAEVFARLLINRAEKGSEEAVAVINKVLENMDYIEAATIIVPRTIVTIKEVAKNGVKPHFGKGSQTNNEQNGNENS